MASKKSDSMLVRLSLDEQGKLDVESVDTPETVGHMQTMYHNDSFTCSVVLRVPAGLAFETIRQIADQGGVLRSHWFEIRSARMEDFGGGLDD